jgi:hypothetical protein
MHAERNLATVRSGTRMATGPFCACERPDMSGPTVMNRKIQIRHLLAGAFRSGESNRRAITCN